jgi:hypothetical protein
MAARASRTENQDAIDATMVGMLADPKEVYQISFQFGRHVTIFIFHDLSNFACLTNRLVPVSKSFIFCHSIQPTKELL